MAKMNETPVFPNALNTIGAGTIITGDVSSNGDIRIDGTLTGNLTTKGKVVIGETGTITGEIVCKSSDISGRLKGKIKVSELLSLKASSVIEGDIVTARLAIEPGARFTGTCSMSEANTSGFGKPAEDTAKLK